MALVAFSVTAPGRTDPPTSASPAILTSVVGQVEGQTAHWDGLGEYYTPHIVVAARVPGQLPPLALPRGPRVLLPPRASIAVHAVATQPCLEPVVRLSTLGLPFYCGCLWT